jgi:hypothetical protein
MNRKRVVDCSGWLDRMDDLDREVWGASRRVDHEYSMRDAVIETQTFGLTNGGSLEGYGYVDARGWIGPIAAKEPETQLALLRIAAERLHERGISDGGAWVLSLNPVMMRAFLDAGWKFERWTFFLSSEPFGRFDRYHPSGGLML